VEGHGLKQELQELPRSSHGSSPSSHGAPTELPRSSHGGAAAPNASPHRRCPTTTRPLDRVAKQAGPDAATMGPKLPNMSPQSSKLDIEMFNFAVKTCDFLTHSENQLCQCSYLLSLHLEIFLASWAPFGLPLGSLWLLFGPSWVLLGLP
jgi:hypothetical protein